MKKLFSTILAAAVLSSASSALASFNDTENHWAKDAIDAWSAYGVISGYDGSFAPDRQITRGEFAVVLNRLMKYKNAAENTFSDLDDAFYTESVLKLNAKGVISGYDGLVNPNGYLTREEAAVMLCRALEIETETEMSRSFDDTEQISDWAYPYVCALVNRGLLNGYDNGGNGMLYPQNTIKRAEVVTILNNAVLPILTPGDTNGLTLDKILVISASDVTVSDCVANGNVIITEGADEGTVTFKNTKLNGYLKINNDREGFVKFDNSTVAYDDVLNEDAIAGDSSATVDSSHATGGKPSSSGTSSSGGSSGGSGSGETSDKDNTTDGNTGDSGMSSGSGDAGSDGSSSGGGSGSSGGSSSGGSSSDSGSGSSGDSSSGGTTDKDNTSGGSDGNTGDSGTSNGSGSSSSGESSSGSGSGSTDGSSSGGTTDKDNTSGGESGGSSSSGDSGDSKDDDIDYASVNAEMVENIESACADIAECLDYSNEKYEIFTTAERKMLKAIRSCMLDSLKYKDSEVIDSNFIKKTYKSEIADVRKMYADMEAAKEDGVFLEHIVEAEIDQSIAWLADAFGLMY